MKTVAVMANTAWNIFNYRTALLRKLKTADYRVIVIATADGFKQKVDTSYFDEWVELEKLKPRGKNPLGDFELWWELRKIMKRLNPDVLLSFTIKPNIFGVMATANDSVICIPTVTGLGSSFIRNNWVSRLTEMLYARSFKLAARVIFHNTDDQTYFIRKEIVSDSQGLVVGGSGVNTSYLRAGSLENHRPFTFLFLGRLLVDKGVMLYLEAAKDLKREGKDFHFILAGDMTHEEAGGISHKTLRSAQDHGIECQGFVENTKEMLERVDCLVLPSFREGMPRAVLEAMAMSRLVIVSNAPGCREAVVDQESGFIFDLNIENDLTRTMLKVAQMDEAEQLEIRQKARKRAELFFDENSVAEKYLEIIEECIG